MEGVKTVRVFSANPKTPDGFNTIIFRRDVARTLRKLAWTPIIDASENPQPEGVELSDGRVSYSRVQKKQLIDFLVSRLKVQYGAIENDDFGIITLQRSFAKEVQRHAIATRREFLAALSARQIAHQMVHFAAAPNEEVGRTNGIRFFEYGLSRVRIAQDIYLVMGVVGVREKATPYYDQHVVGKFKVDSEASSIQGHMQFGESTLDEIYDNRFRLILQGVEEFFAETRKMRQEPKSSPALCAAEKCTGCAACHDACAKGAISMVPDGEGFAHPQVDVTKCVRCGRCEQVCPVLHLGAPREPLAVYAAKAKDDELRLQSSSGGIFSLLARQIIREGGIVFGAGWDKSDWHVVHKSAENELELDELRGSKYVQSDTRGIYAKVKAQLATGRLVLFSGTPCQIAALRMFLGREYENLFLIDVICHAVPSPLAWQNYLEVRLSAKNGQGAMGKQEIKRISFRRKDCGWKRYSLSLSFTNDSEYRQTLDKDPFLQAFLNEFCNRPSCQSCPFKSGTCGSDLTLGDYWGIATAHRGVDDDKGISVALVNTQKGEKQFNGIPRDFLSIPSKYKYLRRLNPAMVNPVVLTARQKMKRTEFFARLGKEDFDSLEVRLAHRPLLRRGLSFVRRCAFWLPNRIVERIVYR